MTQTVDATDAPPATRRRGARVSAGRKRVALLAGLAGLCVLAVLSVLVGAQPIAPAEVWRALTAFDPASTRHLVITELRIPRTVLGMLVGAALGISGTIMQAITRNPLAEPGLLGITAGAAAFTATGIAITAVLGGGVAALGAFGHVGFAFVGAAVSAVLVAALGGAFRQGTDPVRLTLAGAALSVVLGAYTSAILINFPEVFDSFRHWGVGSLQGRDSALMLPAAAVILPAIVVALALGRSLNAVALGGDLGRSVGANPRRTLLVGGLVVVVLVGAATAVAGPIGFVGLTAPLAVRMLVGPDYRWILPLSAVYAAVLVVGADIIGRVLLPPAELETSIVTAIIGAPVFIALVRRRRLVRL